MAMNPRVSPTSSVVTLLACAAFAPLGCASDEGTSGHAELPVGTPVAVEEQPDVAIGERPSDRAHELWRVTTPFLLRDGRVAVPLAGEGEIRIFDREGELVSTVGSPGEGPGEFDALSAAWARGDTIEAFDGRLRRVTRFAPGADPEVVRLETVPSAQGAVAALDDGSWILQGVKEVTQGGRDRQAVHRFHTDGAHLGELLELGGIRRHEFPGGATGPDPLSPRGVVRVAGGEVFVGETVEPRIEAVDPASGTRRALEWDGDPAWAGGDPVGSVRDSLLALALTDEDQAHVRARFDVLGSGADVPVFWDFLVDEEGFVWVRPYEPMLHAVDFGGMSGPGPGGDWLILSPDGEPLTNVTLPSELEPVGITSDAVIGIRRDDLDVESVRVHRLRRSGDGDGS